MSTPNDEVWIENGRLRLARITEHMLEDPSFDMANASDADKVRLAGWVMMTNDLGAPSVIADMMRIAVRLDALDGVEDW
jgi:hypothetical protein